MCLNTYSRVRVGKRLSDMFLMKNGLNQALFNFALYYAFRRVQVNQDGLKLNGTHHLPVYADNVNIMGGSVYSIKKNRSFSSC